MTSGAELVSQRLAQAPPLVIQESPPVDPTSIPVPEGPIESGSAGSKDSKHGSGAPAQAGGEAAEESGEPRAKRGFGDTRERVPSPAVSESRRFSRPRGVSPPAFRGGPSVEQLRRFWDRHHQGENEEGNAMGVRSGSDGYGELKRGRLDERYFRHIKLFKGCSTTWRTFSNDVMVAIGRLDVTGENVGG